MENFSWATVESEIQWSHMEPEQGKYEFRECDELLEWCKEHNVVTRAHSIFSETERGIPQWVRELDESRLIRAAERRMTTVLARYKDKFRHYSVNDEMMHGSFLEDKLGKKFLASMCKRANEIASSSILFVNDCHLEDAYCARVSPENYRRRILELQEQGAPVGGVGIQGHVSSPVGPIICSALDKLATLGLPIWLTGLDVTSPDDITRAEDLEVVLREAFAHPAVDGIMLSGFWELMME